MHVSKGALEVVQKVPSNLFISIMMLKL